MENLITDDSDGDRAAKTEEEVGSVRSRQVTSLSFQGSGSMNASPCFLSVFL